VVEALGTWRNRYCAKKSNELRKCYNDEKRSSLLKRNGITSKKKLVQQIL
jgi:hypothetical protein